MPLDIIVGAQWGDEGKGRIVDLLSSQSDYVARYNGGDNAGHTVTTASQTFKLHLLPSGLIHPHTIGVLGNGMVINPATLLNEMEMFKRNGLTVGPDRLQISYAAHLITPAHIALDRAREQARRAGMIGTTLRGIGPAYTSKACRGGVRLETFLNADELQRWLNEQIEETNAVLTHIYHQETLDAAKIIAEYQSYAEILKPYITDTSLSLYDALQKGANVLAEGAQGTLLDLDQGTYPFVTSSHPTAPGALIGLGLGAGWVRRVIGVTKAFQTRVGEGPFPTEVHGDLAGRLRGTGANPWDEYGTTTGRPRRVGWLDLPLLRYAARVNGLTELMLTKLDVLSGFETIQICTGYLKGGQTSADLPLGAASFDGMQAVYDTLPGWEDDIHTITTWEGLPQAARTYVRFIEDQVGVSIRLVSVGPERNQALSPR
jgi:adenylosuccinate synthase